MDKTSVTIEYHSNGKLLLSIWSEVYPQYKTGETLTLETIPTNRERTRRPAREFTQKFYRIEKIHHLVRESKNEHNLFTLHLEVFLNELSEESEKTED